jgi:hypothetical protein
LSSICRKSDQQWPIIQELERDGHNARDARKLLDTRLRVREAQPDLRDQLIKLLEAEEPQALRGYGNGRT